MEAESGMTWPLAKRACCLSMGLSRQGYWSGQPCPPPGELPHPGIELASLMHWQVGSLPLEPPGKPWAVSRSWEKQRIDDLL